MDSFRKLSRSLLFPMAFILPFWITIGRAMLGSQGIGTLFTLFVVSPILFLVLLILHTLATSRQDVKVTKQLGKTDSILMACVYVSVFLFGFFIVDGSGNIDVAGEYNTNSASFALFGKGFENIAQTLSDIFMSLSIIFVFIALLVMIYERTRKPLP